MEAMLRLESGSGGGGVVGTETNYKYYIIIYKCSTAAPRHQHLLGGAMRGGSGGAGGPGSPGEDRWSVSADPFGSRSAAAYRKSPLGPDHRSVFALRLCPTPTPTVSRPGASYPSRRSLNAELWVRSFQLLTHSSADDQILPGCPMFRGPELEEHVFFG